MPGLPASLAKVPACLEPLQEPGGGADAAEQSSFSALPASLVAEEEFYSQSNWALTASEQLRQFSVRNVWAILLLTLLIFLGTHLILKTQWLTNFTKIFLSAVSSTHLPLTVHILPCPASLWGAEHSQVPRTMLILKLRIHLRGKTTCWMWAMPSFYWSIKREYLLLCPSSDLWHREHFERNHSDIQLPLKWRRVLRT